MPRVRSRSRPGRRPIASPLRGGALRPVRPADLPFLLRQRSLLYHDIGGVRTSTLRHYLPRFRRWFLEEFRAGRLSGYLALDGRGRPVASALAWLRPRQPSPRFPHTSIPYVFSVVTAPAYRRRGLASRLVARLVSDARACGYPRVELHATEAGRSIYARQGFRATNEMRLDLLPPAPRRARDRGLSTRRGSEARR
ncbi:MAG TPA: GNAT family N-acetyltransferase [Thermoplasmata archaeon]|nr:GNAT family N-acetyltransferase [Thermoplasmata archaeon]